MGPDQNGEWSDGVYVGGVAFDDAGQRVPTSIAYLAEEVRRRPTLRIVTDRHVDRILFDGTRATGAVTLATADAAEETWQAQEVVV